MAAARASADRRGGILSAARAVFDARGYGAATIEEVARRAGIAKGSVYNYFASKQDLFAGVFTEALAGDMVAAEELLRRPLSAAEKIDRLLDEWFGRLEQHKRFGRLVLEFWATAAREKRRGDLNAWFRRAYRHWRGRLAKVVAQGVQSGEFGAGVNTVAAASLILAVTDGIAVQMMLDVGIKVDREFLAALKRAIFSGLAAGHAARRTRASRARA